MTPHGVRGPERLLPIACAISALLLFASEFMNTFVITESVRGGICELAASDRHLYAFAVLAVFALIALAIAIYAPSKPAATAVAACGVIALGLFLAIDLPDATATGTLGEGCSPVEGSFAEVSVEPLSAFWIELAGALGLAVTGLALSTFTPAQLAALAPTRLRRRDRDDGDRDEQPPGGGHGERSELSPPFDARRNEHGGNERPGTDAPAPRSRRFRRSVSGRTGPR